MTDPKKSQIEEDYDSPGIMGHWSEADESESLSDGSVVGRNWLEEEGDNGYDSPGPLSHWNNDY